MAVHNCIVIYQRAVQQLWKILRKRKHLIRASRHTTSKFNDRGCFSK